MKPSDRSTVRLFAGAVTLLSVTTPPARGQPACAPAATAATTRGWEAYRRDSIAVARIAFAEALRGCPVNSDAQVGLGFVALRQGLLAEANRNFTDVTRRDSSYADAWDGLATTANRPGNVAGAVRAARRVIALDTKNTAARALLDRLAPDWERASTPPV